MYKRQGDSYTDGKTVTISSKIDETDFDPIVGLALHEGSHILLSDFDFLKTLGSTIPKTTYALGISKGMRERDIREFFKNMLNFVEDRRIDHYIVSSSPGYKGYYLSMYQKYFNSPTIDKGLKTDEMTELTLDSYMFRIINLHNKNRQLTALKGLKEIYQTINLGGIQRGLLSETRQAFNVACDVMSLILLSIDPIKPQSQDSDSDDENGDSQEGNGSGGSNTLTDEELQDMIDSDSIGSSTTPDENLGNDDGSDSVELSQRQKDMLKKHFEKQEKFLDGDVQKTKLNKKESTDIKSIEDSGATYENVGSDIPKYDWDGSSVGKGTKCLVVRKLTQAVIDSGQFGCASSYNQTSYGRYEEYNFVEEGLRLGSMLGRKLQVRGEESQLKFSRQDSGKIDKRLIAELGFGNSNVFSHTLTERYNKAYLHISVDASGSMSGKKWNKAMTSAVSMIKACDMAGNIDVVVTTRTTNYGTGGGQGTPMIVVCYDSRVDKLIKVKNLFTALGVSGTTPEGLCFEAIEKDLIPGNSNQDSYFINFSDGQPWYSNNEIEYSGDRAEKHTKKMCDGMRAKGISVLSYFIGGNYESRDDNKAFTNMYGNDAEFINSTNMMQVAKTMNKKFLEV